MSAALINVVGCKANTEIQKVLMVAKNRNALIDQ